MIREEYQFWIGSIERLGGKRIKQLLAKAGTIEELYHWKKEEILSVPGIGEKIAESILYSRNTTRIQEEYAKMQAKGVRYICVENEQYPDKLKNLQDAPFGLFVKGELPKNDILSVAIVGARNCTAYGRKTAREYGEVLGACNVQVISGMALGVDGISQSGAITTGGKTYGVLGCGVDICYPKENFELYMKLTQKGGIISEYAPEVMPHASHFPARNRIISGLSDIIIVIEAKEKSGSLITVDYALEQGKDVYAVPGRIYDELSGGCNKLIKQGAGIVLSPQDLIKELELIPNNFLNKSKKNKKLLETKENMVYSCLDLLPKNLDTILMETGLSVSEGMGALLELELKDLIRQTSPNYYEKNDG